MNKTQHTPTPWKWIKEPEGFALVETDYKYNKDQILFHGADWHMKDIDKNFIVRAVNAHEDLIKIARAYYNHLKMAAHTEDEVRSFNHIAQVLAEGGK